MLKKFAVLGFSVLFFIACGNTAKQTTAGANVSAPQSSNDTPLVSGHSGNAGASSAPQNSAAAAAAPQSGAKTKWTQSGNPIDVSALDAEIARAEKNLKAKPENASAKKTLAEAFLKRGVALTDARQYASALGDYRRALKYDAENEEAKTWIKQIIGIYESINRESPNEGEEPPPLPFKKAV